MQRTDEPEQRLRLRRAAELLPYGPKRRVLMLPDHILTELEEIRLRIGRPLTVRYHDREHYINADGALTQMCCGEAVTAGDLGMVIEIAAERSVYAAQESIRHGFITVCGGHRLGICGTAVTKNGEVSFIKNPSSVAIRLAREVKGAAYEATRLLWPDMRRRNVLIISPPGVGKTTMLRDMARLLGCGIEGSVVPRRVGIADERSEIAACNNGVPQFDIGPISDVIEACRKSDAVMMLLRGMSPDVIALDEITAAEDIRAMETASHCGVSMLATAHADTAEDLYKRPLYRGLMEQGLIDAVLRLENRGGRRGFELCRAEALPA